MRFPWWLFSADEEGQGLTEYGLTLVLIAIAVVAILAILGSVVNTELWTKAWNELRCVFTDQCASLLPIQLVVSEVALLL